MDIVAIYGSRASEATKNRRDRTARHGPLHDKSRLSAGSKSNGILMKQKFDVGRNQLFRWT